MGLLMKKVSKHHTFMESWQGPVIVGGDFNLIRFASDKIMLGLVINGLMLSMSGFISGSC